MDSGKRNAPEKQDKRSAETRRTNTLMRRLLVGLKSRLDEELRPKNVTSAQLRLLHEVKERPGASGAQMARACYVTPQSLQALMMKAVARGWVARGTDEANHRLVTARLTPAGERLLVYADEVLAKLEVEVWGKVSVVDLRAMNETLERGLERLEG